VLYLERIPAAPLAGYIQSLWCAQAPQVPHQRERVLPTGRVQVILNLARDFLLDCVEGQHDHRVSPSLIVGARSVYEIIDTSDMADLIGIVFAPGGFTPFTRDAADLFSNRSVALQDAWGLESQTLRDRLRDLPTPRARLLCLEGFLMNRLAFRPLRRRGRHDEITHAIRWFKQAPSIASVKEMTRYTGWSERRFSQVFREEVGLSPKVWCRVQRFQRAVRQLHAGADIRWSELALDCGYYDQSHFANEFRAFSGIDATTYSSQRTRWANHIAVD
jgi:AraC-like DNA-binding protein